MNSPLSKVLTSLSVTLTVCGALACSSNNSGSGGGTSDAGGSCPATPTTCPSTPPSFKTDVQPLIETYCYQCHSTSSGQGWNNGNYDWTQLSKLQANGMLIADEVTETDMCNMPYVSGGATAIPSAAERTTIAEWAGPCMAPNN